MLKALDKIFETQYIYNDLGLSGLLIKEFFKRRKSNYEEEQ